ncbi:MAG: PfkB family carbohydrate kinase [Candidatus Tectimicrobiota bacterium]
MSLLVVGSVAFDDVRTPFGEARDVLGGSAAYFAIAASYFADVNLVAVVGDDFPDECLQLFRDHRVNVEGLERRVGHTFRWSGEYGFDLSEATTLATHLNVFETFEPKIPASYRTSPYVFLANIDPVLQLQVLGQMEAPKLVASDTMNFWIEGKPAELKGTLRHVDLLTINDSEARELARQPNIYQAAQAILAMGPSTLLVKRGEYGALMFNEEAVFAMPAYPLETVFDPTGAGDSFAGGFMGYLANVDNVTEATMRQAIIMGSVMASFNVEAFSLDRLKAVTYPEIRDRFRAFRRLVHFDDLDPGELALHRLGS